MNKIYTYTSLTAIENCSWFDELKNYPQITVSTDLRKGINNQSLGFKYKAYDFRQIISKILPSWTTSEAKFQETVILSQYLRERIQAAKDAGEKKWLTGCRRNVSSILSAIILLEEAKVVPDDIIPEDKNMELFVDSWKYLLEKDSEIQEFRKKLENFDSHHAVEKIISETYGKLHERKLVLHGFYYFTPIQKRILDILKNHGFDFIFLFQYDQRHTIANEIWTQTYSVANGYEDTASWTKSVNSEGNAFGDLLEGKTAKIPRNVKVIEYKSILEFVNDMKRAKTEKFSIYSPSQKHANDILKDFYPEEYGDRKLLSYPVGQFIYTLHNMWDDEEQTIILDADSLRQCFSSGWISIEETTCREYTNDLEFILPFFEGCRTVEEWNDRLDYLEEIDDNAIGQFRSRMSTHPDAELRWQETYNNPFNSFSMFAISKDRLNVVISFISKIIEMACSLFDKNCEINIGDHISKLNDLLKEHANAKNIYAEEKIIIDELFKRFNKTKNSTVKCFPADISAALNLLMDGAYEDEENTSSVGMVYPLYQIDAAGIKNKGKVHICLADGKNLPGSEKEYIWPLTEKVMEELFKKTGNTYLTLIKYILKVSPIANRYFLYSALQNPDVEISWISNMEEKLRTPSPYIQILKTLGGVIIDPICDKIISESHVNGIELSKKTISEYTLSIGNRHVAKEAMMDYALCPMRYVYGYLLQKYPVYQSAFLQNYAINGLITAVNNLVKDTEITVSEIEDNVHQLFPNLRGIEKRQIKDYLKIESEEKNDDQGMTSEYADVAYTDERMKIKFPEKKIRQVAKKLYGELLTPDGRKGVNLDNPTDIPKACVFCQHSEYCKNAVFNLDQEEYYD